MASQPRLINWAFDHQQLLNLSVTKAEWTLEYGLDHHDYHVVIKHNGIEYIGNACDPNEELALTKAIAEAVERVSMGFFSFRTSNGLAAHTDPLQAIKLSQLELIERDAYFCHHLTQQNAEEIFYQSSNKNLQAALNCLHSQGICQKFYSLNSLNDTKTILLVTSGIDYIKPFGGLINTATFESSDTLNLDKILIENLRNIHFLTKNSFGDINESEFFNLKKFDPIDHLKLGLNISYFKKCIDFLNSPLMPYKTNQKISIQSKILNLNNTILEKCPIFIAQSVSNQLQNLFFGISSPEKINYQRLKTFVKDFTPNLVNLRSHIYA